tara:strand:- start:42 stop:701 length:660 start_codon:yes stop_codon:yes gene_type:complete
VALSLVPQQAKKIAPPRVLSVPFILGRPFGSPEDASFQHRVLDAALGLFTQTDSPIFSEFSEEAPEISESPEEWVCPVSFNKEKEESLLENVKNEIALLKPWFERRKTVFGKTSFGISDVDLEDLAPFIHAFFSEEQNSKSDSSRLKLATDDLNAFYLEAALQQPSASEISAFENWYWNETAAGELVKKVALHCQKSLDPGLQKTAKLLIVPERIISWN